MVEIIRFVCCGREYQPGTLRMVAGSKADTMRGSNVAYAWQRKR